MEFSNILGVLEILKEAMKIIPRNGRLMGIVISIYLILSSVLFLLNFSSIKPLISDSVTRVMLLPSIDPNGLLYAKLLDGFRKDVKALLSVELAFFLAFTLVSLFAQTGTVLLTAISYKDKKLFPKDLIMRLPWPSTRLFITSFHVTLSTIGFCYFAFITEFSATMMVYENMVAAKVIFWILAILLVSLYLYLSVVWVLALVVSVLEESYGIEALGKAGRLIQGKRLEGFALNFLFKLLAAVFVYLSKLILFKKSATVQAILGLLVVCIICLMVLLEYWVYTILYFKCKKNHGEEIELQGSMEYSKLASTPVVREDYHEIQCEKFMYALLSSTKVFSVFLV